MSRYDAWKASHGYKDPRASKQSALWSARSGSKAISRDRKLMNSDISELWTLLIVKQRNLKKEEFQLLSARIDLNNVIK